MQVDDRHAGLGCAGRERGDGRGRDGRDAVDPVPRGPAVRNERRPQEPIHVVKVSVDRFCLGGFKPAGQPGPGSRIRPPR